MRNVQSSILTFELFVDVIVRRSEGVYVRLVDGRPWQSDGGAGPGRDDAEPFLPNDAVKKHNMTLLNEPTIEHNVLPWNDSWSWKVSQSLPA